MITTALKDWLAINAGIANCYSPSGISYTDPDGIARVGSTGEVLNAFVVAHLVGKDTAVIIAGINYTQLKVINEGNDLVIDDVAFAYNNDGDPVGEPLYCAGVIPPPTEPGLAGVFEFLGPPVGLPTIILDLSDLTMRQSSVDYHFEMNDLIITSTSTHQCYIALEVRLFSGALTECPVSGAAFVGMDRVSTTRAVRIKLLDPGETINFNADFYQPGTLLGVHTVCLLVHGTWTRSDLVDEVAPIIG